jgi:hypothetical protein
MSGPAAWLIDFIVWLDWCLYAYIAELVAIVVSLFIVSCYLKGMPPFANSKPLSKGLFRESLIIWLVYCAAIQGYPAVG